jgi:hypothetical protein
LDVVFFILVIILGLVFINSFKKTIAGYDIQILRKLFFFHLLFGAYYCFFIHGDAEGYWLVAKSLELEEVYEYLGTAEGTYFLFALNYLPAKVLGLSYFVGTMIYSLIGFIGLTYFYLIAIKLVPYNSKFGGLTLFPLLFFLPNLHFWSSAVGKDTLLFFCIGLFFYGIMAPFKRIHLLIIGIGLSYFIRPHMTLFMLVSLSLVYATSSKISTFQRIVFGIIMIGLSIQILPAVLEFAKVEEATLDSFEEFSENKAALLSRGNTGSRIDISSYPFPLKVFTFLFRPLFFDINGIPALLASIENLLLLLLTVKVLSYNAIRSYRKSPFVIKGLVIFLLIGTVAFSQSLGNLGVMIRMRNMFLPGLIIFILWSFSYKQQLSNTVK